MLHEISSSKVTGLSALFADTSAIRTNFHPSQILFHAVLYFFPGIMDVFRLRTDSFVIRKVKGIPQKAREFYTYFLSRVYEESYVRANV